MINPPSLFITGANGHLGQLVIDALLEQLPKSSIVAGVRDLKKDAAIALGNKGIELRVADYSRPETLASAFSGIDRLLLISSSENGQRITQHRNVISAAKNAGISLIAYTSILRADTSPLLLAREHLDTEAALVESGVPYTILRNGWYNEVYTWRLPLAFKQGVLAGAAGKGRISSAARADYAKAAARVLADGNHAGRIYELAGDTSFTLSDLAKLVTEVSGKSMAYHNMSADEFKSAALAAGLPDMMATILSDTDSGIEKGALFDDGHELSGLIGGPTTPLSATITEFIRNFPSH